MSESRPIPWSPEETCVCLIGCHGRLFEVAAVIAGSNVNIGAVASHVDDANGKVGVEAVLAEHGLFPSMREVAQRANAPLLYLPDPNAPEAIDRIRQTGVNLVLSVSAPILKPAFIDAFDGWVFNFHGSRHFRGRAGLSWILLNGFTEDAVVLHWINRGIDTGDAVAEASYCWSEDAYPLDLFRAQRSSYEDLTGKFLRLLAQGMVPKIPQDSSRLYLPSLKTDEDGWIDWVWSPEDAERAVRAFGWPYSGASTFLEDANRSHQAHLRIGRCRIPDGRPQHLHPLTNGSILRCEKHGHVDVACGSRVLRIETFRRGDGEVPAGDVARVGMRLRNGP